MAKNSKIEVLSTEISVQTSQKEDYISLTDIARYKNRDRSDDLVRNWLGNRNTIEFLGIWERLNNPDFKGVEFDSFVHEAGANAFTLSPQQWISATSTISMWSFRWGTGLSTLTTEYSGRWRVVPESAVAPWTGTGRYSVTGVSWGLDEVFSPFRQEHRYLFD
nr:KilA-N domain-containing protein [Pelodictyon luteolum]